MLSGFLPYPDVRTRLEDTHAACRIILSALRIIFKFSTQKYENEMD